MLKSTFLKLRKGIRRHMYSKLQACKEILTNAQNRLILGLILIGLGGGLVASAYISVL